MRRKLLAACIAVALALAFIVPTASAVPKAADRAPAPASNYSDNCPLSTSYQSNGTTNSTPNISQNRSGVTAEIDIPTVANGWGTCDGLNINLQTVGPSAYVGIAARPGGTNTGSLLLGIITCDKYQPPVTYCHGDDSLPHWIVQVRTCGGFAITTDLGAADYGAHTYTIYLDVDNYWHYKINGTQVHTTHVDDLCWDHQLREALWYGAKFAEEDSLGNSNTSSTRTNIDDAEYGIYGQGWVGTSPFAGQSNCLHEGNDDTCDIVDANTIRVWTPDN